MIENLKTSGEWKIHLTMKMDFVLTMGFINCQMHCKKDDSELMTGFDKD